MVSLVMLRSMVRSVPAASAANSRAASVSPGGQAGVAAAQTEPEEVEEVPATPAKTRRFAVAGGSLADELSELVSTDPDLSLIHI